MFNTAKSIISKVNPTWLQLPSTSPSRLCSLFTPDYLNALKPKIPQYPTINVKISGYAFPILEHYQRFIHNIAEQMNFEVPNSFALPAKSLKVQRLKPQSAVVDMEYAVNLYERNIQINNVSSVRFPVFVRIVEAAIPEGVIMDIEEWDHRKEELRYIPDKQLLDLKYELEDVHKK